MRCGEIYGKYGNKKRYYDIKYYVKASIRMMHVKEVQLSSISCFESISYSLLFLGAERTIKWIAIVSSKSSLFPIIYMVLPIVSCRVVLGVYIQDVEIFLVTCAPR